MTFRSLVGVAFSIVVLTSVLNGCATRTETSLDALATGVTVTATRSVLGGVTDAAYPEVTFKVDGAPDPNASYYWTLSGSLPPGLETDPADNITPKNKFKIFGTPTQSGHFAFKLTVHTVPEHNILVVGATFAIDISSTSCTSDSSGTIELSPTSMFWPADLPNYTESLSAIGGCPGYQWTASGLPGTLTLDRNTGTLSGTTAPGSYEAQVTIVDAKGRSVQETLKLQVVTVAQFKGTWTGIVTAGEFAFAGQVTDELAGQRLSLIFNDQGLITQGALHSTVIKRGDPTSTEVFDFGNGYPGAFNGDVFQFPWHIACLPLDNGDLKCIGHYLDPNYNALFVLTKMNSADQDPTPPGVSASSFVADYPATGGTETLTFTEAMSSGSAVGVGPGGKVDSVTFSSDMKTATVALSGLTPLTNHTLTLNPAGTGFLDLGGNALPTRSIPFSTPAPGANRPPTAQPSSVTATQGVARPITLVGADLDNDPLTYAIATGPSHGALSAINGTSVTYTSQPTYVGQDSFTFTASDGLATSAPATVTINVSAPSANQPPTATGQSVTTIHGQAKAITLVGNDPEGGLLTYTIEPQPTKGTLSGSGNARTYTPTSGTYVGPDSFAFTVTDSGGLPSAPATVSITITNQAPTATPRSVFVGTGTSKVITLAGTDGDSDLLTFAIAGGPSNGTLSAVTGSSVTYTPNGGYTGPDSFSFTASDGIATSSPASVSLTVAAPNDAPSAKSQNVPAWRTRQWNTADTYIFQYAITLTGSDTEDGTASPPLRFKITQWPNATWDSTYPTTTDPVSTGPMSMEAGQTYRVWDPATNTWVPQIATTSTTVNRVTGEITVDPPGSPVTIIYVPATCHVDSRLQSSFQFTVTDSTGQESAPGTVNININFSTCSHPPLGYG